MENKPVPVKSEVKVEESHKAKVAKIFAIVIFALVMTALVGAIVSDIAIFANQIIGFIVACLGAAVVFILGFIVMIISIILIFGVYLLDSNGFWPLTWAKNVFTQVMADHAFTSEQKGLLLIIRLALIIICLIVFVLAIVALAMSKSAKKDGYTGKRGLTIAFRVISLILSIFGLFAATVVLLILSVI